jgi:hypothetical protein
MKAAESEITIKPLKTNAIKKEDALLLKSRLIVIFFVFFLQKWSAFNV